VTGLSFGDGDEHVEFQGDGGPNGLSATQANMTPLHGLDHIRQSVNGSTDRTAPTDSPMRNWISSSTMTSSTAWAGMATERRRSRNDRTGRVRVPNPQITQIENGEP